MTHLINKVPIRASDGEEHPLAFDNALEECASQRRVWIEAVLNEDQKQNEALK